MFPYNFYSSNGHLILTALIAIALLTVFTKRPDMWIFDWRVILPFLILGNTLDYFSTALFVSTQGIDAEGNYFPRQLMKLGWHWFAIYKLIILNYFFAVLALLSRRVRIAAPCLLALSIMLALTVVHNVVAYIKFSP